MRLNNVIVIALTLLSAPVMGAGDMFLDLSKDSNVSSLNDRHYSASLGRFITPDVAKISISEYTYMNGDVIVGSDPSGLGPWKRLMSFFKKAERQPIEFASHGLGHQAFNDDASTIYVRNNQPGRRSTVNIHTIDDAIIPTSEAGANPSSQPRIDMDILDGDEDDQFALGDMVRNRLKTHNEEGSNPYHHDYNPAWNKGMGKDGAGPVEADRDITQAKERLANISDDDLGDPINRTPVTQGGHSNPGGSSFVTIPPFDTMPTLSPTQAAAYDDRGLFARLTKTKKIAIASGVVILSAGAAALTAYFLLKNKYRSIAPGPSPAPPGPIPTPCPGMTPHPPPC